MAIDAAIASASSSSSATTPSPSESLGFNSARGLEASILIDLVMGFQASLVTTIYNTASFDLATTIIYIFSTKKVMAFSVGNIAVLTDKKTYLSETIQVQISVAIIEVQAQIIAAGFELETTEADIEALVFPVPIEIPTAPELTKIEILTNDLEAMCANSNGLELSVTAISTALASTSLTGTSAEIVLELVASIEALSVALYGADLTNTVIQELCAQLITATIVGPSVALSVEQQV